MLLLRRYAKAFMLATDILRAAYGYGDTLL